MQSIVHNNLISPNVEERIDAARHLGALRVGDTMVLYALRERLKHDDEKRVVYESAKALATIGEFAYRALATIGECSYMALASISKRSYRNCSYFRNFPISATLKM